MTTNDIKNELPEWIIDRGNGDYIIDIEAAKTAGETIPIQLGKIPQFAPFFTNPPTKSGRIDFINSYLVTPETISHE